ncbi:pimeloyl-ACP methyl ester carboxylesterase [Chryseobacterium ginsenosidimutans]|uniref:alpha/beta hydrolase n=1 Tax=Chryseobacterium ginsenosidimutans TaxID=687846 RepID=UPI00278881D7|nr:alpha/beta hydrolase [Chryseobacterium ginsenosidimutans]MDQ0593607.1 pimeloyl-ACP methyl ester carboxylesterase [Chryseobacterium ginsenosidimutans]
MAKRIGLGLITLIIFLLIAGFIFERISRNDAEKINPDGNFVEIENHRLHYYKTGNGGPTVVFETAFDPAGHLQWYNIQKELPTSYTSVSYDRTGILWSERGKNPKSGEQIAAELHLLLEKANVPKPYILVGHSFGGTLVRFFVNKYPDDVAGIVLVDSQCPDDDKYLSPELFKMANQGLPSGFLKFANTFGLARLMFKGMFPKDKQYEYQNTIMPALLYKSAYAVLEEQVQMSSIKKKASKIKSFGNIPLYVLTAADGKRYDSSIKDLKLKTEMLSAWNKMQKDFLLLSTDSKQITVPNSGHYINQEQPKVIENAINDMVNKISSQK